MKKNQKLKNSIKKHRIHTKSYIYFSIYIFTSKKQVPGGY